MAIKILILGTSNSLLKYGWVYGLRGALPSAHIDNFSLGGSPGIQFGVYAKLDFSRYDYVFFDSIPNDEQYTYETPGFNTPAFYNTIIYELLSAISSRSRLIVMGFCLSRYLNDPSFIFKSRWHMAQACRAQFLDARLLVNELGRDILQHDGSLYENHPAHPAAKISRCIGQAIGSVLSAGNCGAYGAENSIDYSSNFSTWSPETDGGDFSIVEFRNSLVAEKFALLTESSAVHFAENANCIGFYVNACSTHCDAQFHNKSAESAGCAKAAVFSLVYQLSPGKLQKFFVPVPNGARVDKSTMSRCVNAPKFRPRMTSSRNADAPVVMALSQVLFWHGVVDDMWASNAAAFQCQPSQLTQSVYERISRP